MACNGSFPSSRGEKHPDPKSGRDLDPDKPGCTITAGEMNQPKFFTCFFLNFGPQSLTFSTDPRVLEAVY